MFVETYEDKQTGNALASNRITSLEQEISEIEMVKRRDLCAQLSMDLLAARCDIELARLRCSKKVKYPLLSTHENQIWSEFLPTKYRAHVGTNLWGRTDMKLYNFDFIPISVLELFRDSRKNGEFDIYEIWTPELQRRMDPILVGFKKINNNEIGPFMIARWGESLETFENIEKQVEARRVQNTFPPQTIVQPFAATTPPGWVTGNLGLTTGIGSGAGSWGVGGSFTTVNPWP